jgi:predicted DsbA family dithiol-disulfide isomerase
MKRKIRIDVVSDIVCPWCYIGKRRLEKAVDELASEFDVQIEYHPFELNPALPPSGTPAKEYLVEKFGGEDRYEQITGRVSQVAAADGLHFDFEKQRVSPNTRKAHALVALASAHGRQKYLVEAFFKAYFTDGIDLSDDNNLKLIAASAGLPEEEIVMTLADPNTLEAIESEEKEMYKLGISGVPFYIINKKFGVSGAQPSEQFVQILKEASVESVTTESCDVEGKNC